MDVGLDGSDLTALKVIIVMVYILSTKAGYMYLSIVTCNWFIRNKLPCNLIKSLDFQILSNNILIFSLKIIVRNI